MGITGEIQLESLLYACGLGFLLGMVYELFRTWRLLFPPSARSCFMQDVFFCITAALMTFFGFLAIADGHMYPYLIIGEITGFFAFYYTVGRFCHELLALILRAILRFLKAVFRVVSRPVRVIFKWLIGKSRGIWNFFVKKSKKICKKVRFFSKKS